MVAKQKIEYEYVYENVLRFWIFFLMMIGSLPIISYLAISLLGILDWSDLRFWVVMGLIAGFYVKLALIFRKDIEKHPMQISKR